jgi:hypothetical protein
LSWFHHHLYQYHQETFSLFLSNCGSINDAITADQEPSGIQQQQQQQHHRSNVRRRRKTRVHHQP